MFENLSDEGLLVIWERTRRMLSTSADGAGLPDYPESHYRWHMAAEEALKLRGFIENPPGIWVRPECQSATTAAGRG